MKRGMKRIIAMLVVAAAAAGVFYIFRPRPLLVETARAVRGPMQVTIDEEAQTRAHDRFTLAAPVTGFLSRIELHEGDPVGRGTVLATVSPLPLDVREETGIRSQIAAAEAAGQEAKQLAARAETAYAQAKREFDRLQALFRTGDVSKQRLEEAESKLAMLAHELDAAKARATAADAETERARAGLIASGSRRGERIRTATIRAPFDSRILRILEKSERAVAAGTPILMLSNPNKIEIVADLLSTDAVNLQPGATVWVEKWGGAQALRARLRTIEPFGFTKVSALGVEEQRVHVIADFVDTPGKLGDGYRVDVRIVVWENENTLQIPASALFRLGSSWYVFVNEAGVARQREVAAGHRNALAVEIEKGLSEGDEVVLHPPNGLSDGAMIAHK